MIWSREECDVQGQDDRDSGINSQVLWKRWRHWSIQ